MNVWRHYLLIGSVIAVAAGLMVRIAYLSVTERDFLKEQGEARSVRVATIPVHRGIIYDRNGEPLAVSTPMVSVWVDPGLTPLEGGDVGRVADVLGVPADAIQGRLERSQNRRFVYLKRRITPETADRLRDLMVPALHFEREYRRFYPAGETTAHIVGMTDVDDVGQEGIELALDARLAGSNGEKRVLRDRKGQTVRDLELIRAPEFGDDVVLSVDLRLQFFAYRELKSVVEHNGATSGSLVMLDVDSGEVLALANQPSFNPNSFHRSGVDGIRNRAITDTYEPGSTVKPLAMLAALESGRYTPSSNIETAPGYFMVGRKMIQDPINRGRLGLGEVLSKSSQVGIAKIALSLDERSVFDAFARAGVGDFPGSGLPGETVGVLTDVDLDKPIGRVTLAYGYGLTLSPMQLAQTYLTLATFGVRRDVSVFRQAPAAGERVFAQRHVREVVRMMEGVVQDTGTAPKARVAGYRVAGKTGTVRKVSIGGYDDERHVAFFAGFAPASDPKVVVVVVVNEPRGEQVGGGGVAAPVFARVMARAMRILGVSPDVV